MLNGQVRLLFSLTKGQVRLLYSRARLDRSSGTGMIAVLNGQVRSLPHRTVKIAELWDT